MARRQDNQPESHVVQDPARRGAEDREVVLEPVFWGLFSLGGFITAFFLPVTILVLSFFVPLGIWSSGRMSYDAFGADFQSVLFRIFMLLVIGGSLFHGAHRFKYILMESGLREWETILGITLYTLAVAGALLTVYYVV